jgi:hypothetical protein
VTIAEPFWTESTPQVRRLLLDEASGRDSGSVTFEFNTENVTLDFEAATATVCDVLGESASETVPLTAFLDRAASYGDDPGHGDGLTVLRRHPPAFRIDSAGGAEPTE